MASLYISLRAWSFDKETQMGDEDVFMGKQRWRTPPYLQPGDIVSLVAPAGSISQEEIIPAKRMLEEWGFQVRLGDTIGQKDFSFAGSDAVRVNDLQKMLDDADVKAILFARGGYGTIRILDALNFNHFQKHPKWLLGFSDITLLHAHVNCQLHIASIHSKMCNSFPEQWEEADTARQTSILSIKQALMGDKMEYTCNSHAMNVTGICSGRLVGGNLKVLESIIGSKTDLETDRCILFLEDTGEYKYSIDRMLWTLERAGKLKKLNGLILGGFNIKPDDPGEEFGLSLYQMVLEKVRKYGYPVCFDFPIGHQPANMAVKCGMIHQLKVGTESVNLKQI